MVKVPTQTFVVNSFEGVVIFSYWWYVTYKTYYALIRLLKNPSNFVELVEEEEADDTDAEEDIDTSTKLISEET